MTKRVLVDTGPLIALLCRKDAHHHACKNFVRDHQGPLLSCWPVITEATWLLRHDFSAMKQLLLSIDEGLFVMLNLDAPAPRWIGGERAQKTQRTATSNH